MFCSKCGARCSDDASYCHKCGSRLYRDDEETENRPPFVPYEVSVRPNFHTILADFGLAEDTKEQWDQLGKRIEELPKGPWNIWGAIWDPYGGGFYFSFISPSVIYKNGWNSFASELDLSASLEPAGVRRELLRSDEGETLVEVYFPWLRLRSSGDGYRLSVQIPEAHWITIQHKEVFGGIADKDVPRYALCGDLETWSPAVEAPVAVIPYEEFEVHFPDCGGPWRYRLSNAWRHSEDAYRDAVERRVKARTRYGWNGKATIEPDGREISAEYSNWAEHRYLLVSYSAL